MKQSRIFSIILVIAAFWSLFACQDDNSTIGSVITSGEVDIALDTFNFKYRDISDLNVKSIRLEDFDSKTGNLMIGSIYTPTYGSLDCSFVTRLMCAPNLQIPDSLFLPERIDSCKLIMGADRSDITGDSLAPQKLSVFRLNKQLPDDINNTFNPAGYYDPQNGFLGSLSYTVSNVSATDSMFYNGNYISINVDLPISFGKEIFEKYKNDSTIFSWPQTMAEKFLPGLYIKPTFGKGCVANIKEIYVAIYYHNLKDETQVTDGDTIMVQKHVTNLSLPFTSSPEVVSSNNINYKPAENIIEQNNNSYTNGECLLTTPGGYIASFDFPVDSLLYNYREKNKHLSTVNELVFYLPAEAPDKENGIGAAENLLLIKASEYDNFFKEGKIPDNISSFTGVYDPTLSRYAFTSMREYFMGLLTKDTITKEDVEFMLIPVEITTETETNSYSGTSVTYVTKCLPYTQKPTLTLVKINEAIAMFSYSTQMIE